MRHRPLQSRNHGRRPSRWYHSIETVPALVVLLTAICLSSFDAEREPELWGQAMADFEAQDAEHPPEPGGVVFVGSSSIRRWNLPKYFPGRDYLNRGFGGSQISDSIHFAEQLILKHAPRCVVVYAGDNDIAAGESPESVARDFRQLTRIIHKRLPETRIVFIAIKPSLKRWSLYPKMKDANARIAAQCAADARLEFLDIATPMLGSNGKPLPSLFVQDGLHLNHDGYLLWSRLLRPLLKPVARQAGLDRRSDDS